MNILKKIESSLAAVLAGALVLTGVQPAAARTLGRVGNAGKATVVAPNAALMNPAGIGAAMGLQAVGSLSMESSLPTAFNATLPSLRGPAPAPAAAIAESVLPNAASPRLATPEAAAPTVKTAPTATHRAVAARALQVGRKTVASGTRALKTAMGSMPTLASVSVGDAHGAGASLEAAMTRTVSRRGAAAPAGGIGVSKTLNGNLNAASGLQTADYARANRSRAGRVQAIAAPVSQAKGFFGAARSVDEFLASPKGMLAVGTLAIATLLAFQLWLPAVFSSLGMLGMTGMVGRNSGRTDAEDAKGVEAAQEASPAQPGPEADPELQAEVERTSELLARVKAEVGKFIVGQEEMIDSILLALIAREHVSLEGLPGVAKTATVNAIAEALDANFKRIQGTPDKEPSDIVGAELLQEQPSEDGQSVIRKLVHEKGPVFANLLLVDEINRMQTKTQSALLEVMQERQVTIGKETYALPKPFILLATQNPIEQEGTYPLAEAQEDRFMFKTIVPQPDAEERREINRRMRLAEKPKVNAVGTLEEFAATTSIAERVSMDEGVADYIQRVLDGLQDPFALGIGKKGLVEETLVTRASILFEKATRINAMMEGRTYVTPEDVRKVAHRIMRHRVKLSWAAGEDYTTDMLIDEVLATVPMRR